MSTEQIWQTKSSGLDDTLALAGQIGTKLHGGEVIELVSDLGGGKTAFVRGLAAGMGSADPVRSPSFTLTNQYKADKLTLYHFDFYRLQEAGTMEDEISELLADPQAVVVVEWAELIADVLPADRLTIAIRPTAEDERELTFTYPEAYYYLIPPNT